MGSGLQYVTKKRALEIVFENKLTANLMFYRAVPSSLKWHSVSL